ncbi:MAG: hypothetical protein JXP73_19170 [Deltaproteobacteria bacterium]|nr:hypothetical protein [Deltaproteobacteria bacterium]
MAGGEKPPSWDQRDERKVPGKNPAPVKPPLAPEEALRLRLVAPATDKTFNLIVLTTWFELRLLSARGKPLVGETCQLFDPSGKIVEKKTDGDGVVRFDGLPLLPPANVDWLDCSHPAVVFPDILEEWADPPAGEFGKNCGERDDHRKHDGMVHFVPTMEARTEVTLTNLTEEQKLQHFIHAYTDNKARYDTASPKVYSEKDQRWNWGKGAVCNQHVNFFLGYWFNYGKDFTTAGSATAMCYLPLFSSAMHKFGSIKHRGYLEFLSPITGHGATLGSSYDPDDETTWPQEKAANKAYKCIEYIRVARYFDFDSGEPTETGKQLIDALGPVNVYSVGDIKSKDVPAAEREIRAWLKKNKATKATGKSDKDIDKMKSGALWHLVFDLDDDDATDNRLVRTLRAKVNWDHHAGILLVRAKGGGPLTPTTKEKELWTFSADGAKTPGPVIALKTFASADLYRKLLHLGIWRCKTLAPGGFAPTDTSDNKGSISPENPPRFLRWG